MPTFSPPEPVTILLYMRTKYFRFGSVNNFKRSNYFGFSMWFQCKSPFVRKWVSEESFYREADRSKMWKRFVFKQEILVASRSR